MEINKNNQGLLQNLQNEYGEKAVKVEITVEENNDSDRELSIIIDKK